MISLKEKIIRYLLEKVKENERITRRKPIRFSTTTIAKEFKAYSRSVSREIRQLRKDGIIECTLIDKIKGKYILHTNGKFHREKFEKMLSQGLEKLETRKVKSNTAQVKELLNGITSNRTLQKTSSES